MEDGVSAITIKWFPYYYNNTKSFSFRFCGDQHHHHRRRHIIDKQTGAPFPPSFLFSTHYHTNTKKIAQLQDEGTCRKRVWCFQLGKHTHSYINTNNHEASFLPSLDQIGENSLLEDYVTWNLVHVFLGMEEGGMNNAGKDEIGGRSRVWE